MACLKCFHSAHLLRAPDRYLGRVRTTQQGARHKTGYVRVAKVGYAVDKVRYFVPKTPLHILGPGTEYGYLAYAGGMAWRGVAWDGHLCKEGQGLAWLWLANATLPPVLLSLIHDLFPFPLDNMKGGLGPGVYRLSTTVPCLGPSRLVQGGEGAVSSLQDEQRQLPKMLVPIHPFPWFPFFLPFNFWWKEKKKRNHQT